MAGGLTVERWTVALPPPLLVGSAAVATTRWVLERTDDLLGGSWMAEVDLDRTDALALDGVVEGVTSEQLARLARGLVRLRLAPEATLLAALETHRVGGPLLPNGLLRSGVRELATRARSYARAAEVTGVATPVG